MGGGLNSYKQGYNTGYITRNRSPWYKMEHRNPPPIILNVFSRKGYKVVRNLSGVYSLTTFHCFYPNLFGLNKTDILFLYLMSNVGHRLLTSSMRNYGNGLNKFEPNDLNTSPVPSEDFLETIPQTKTNELMSRLASDEKILPEVDALFSALI